MRRAMLDAQSAALRRNQAIQEDLAHSREQMRLQFESLAQQILEAKGQTLRQDSQRTLDEMLRPFREQLAGFQLRVNQVHDESVKGQTALNLELQRMQEMGLRMSAEAHSLAVALKGRPFTEPEIGTVLPPNAVGRDYLAGGGTMGFTKGFTTEAVMYTIGVAGGCTQI